MEVLAKVDSLVAAEPAVQSRTIISGYSFIGGQGPSYGSVIIKLKDWEERSMMQNSDIIYSTLFLRAQKVIKDAQVLFFAPPMIPGYSVSSDIELNMQDKTGGTLDHFFEVVKAIQLHWKHVRKSTLRRLPSARASRSISLTLMRQLVKGRYQPERYSFYYAGIFWRFVCF